VRPGARGPTDQPSRPDPILRAVALVALALLVCACAGSGGGASSAHRSHDVVRADRPYAGAKAAALRYLRRVEAHTHPSRLRVRLALLSRGRHSETLLATPSARLGGGPGTTWTGLGQRALVLAPRDGRLRVVADVTKSGRYALLQDGAAAMPRGSTFVAGRRSVVVAAPGVPAADAAEVVRVADSVMPGLNARYRLPGARPHLPLIFMIDTWGAAQRISGVVMPHEAIGAEYQGVVYLRAAQWAGEEGVQRDALLVHELTHVASANLVLGGPLSLIEGVARYEEQRYVEAHGVHWPYHYMAAAYAQGYPSMERWRWAFGHWMVNGTLPLWLAYEDGAAIVAAVVRDGGDAGLRRLGAAFRRYGVAGRFSRAQVGRAFQVAVGRSFAAVAAQARAATIGASG
jgi:hypothetical protein